MALVKTLPAMLETQVRSMGQEDPPGEGKGNTLRFLPGEPKDRGAWWATVHGAAESETTE